MLRLALPLLFFQGWLPASDGDDRIRPLLAKLHEGLQVDRAMDTMRSVQATDRWFTFPKFAQTVDYLQGRLSAAGLSDVELGAAPADGHTQAGFWTMPMAWDARWATLEIVAPERIALADYQATPSSLGMWSGSTPPGGITAEVMELRGAPGPEVKGKLVMTSQNPAGIKWLLAKYGAAGAINAFTENPSLLDGRQWINAWGDRGWAFTKDNSPLLSFSITPRQATQVRRLLASGQAVRAHATVDTRYYEGKYPYVSALLPGSDSGAGEVLALGHVAEQGANDNATGVATLVEAMTLLRETIARGKLPQPRRAVRVLLMPELYGSMHYVVSQPQRMRRTVAAIAVDTPAAPYELAGTEFTFHMNPHVAASYVDELILRVAAAHLASLTPPRPWHEKPFTPGTDSFLADPTVGVPTVWPYSGTGVQTHHNSEDTPKTVDRRSLRDLTLITAAYLYTIAAAGPGEIPWLAQIARERAERQIANAKTPELRAYQIERGRASILSVLRLAPAAAQASARQSIASELEKLGPLKPKTAAAAGVVVRRKRPGTIPLDDLPQDQWEGFPSGAWDTVPTIALYWCDGKRTLPEVIRLTQLETGPTTFDFAGYFKFLERKGYVEFAK